MKKHLSYQKLLMEKALQLQKDMVMYQQLFGGLDDKYVAEKVKECEVEYAGVITELTKHFCKITGFEFIPAVQNNVVSMAEACHSVPSSDGYLFHQ